MTRCSSGQGCCYILLSPQLRYFFHYFPHREGPWAATTGFDMDDQQATATLHSVGVGSCVVHAVNTTTRPSPLDILVLGSASKLA